MQIKKETVISVLTTSGETINAGDTVVFNFEDKCCVGVYMGLSDRGALKFKGKISDTDVTFHVMPRSIKEIYKADVTVLVHHGQYGGIINKMESEEE